MPLTKVYATIFRDLGRKWRWNIKRKNGKLTAASGESFYSKTNAIRSVKAFVRSIRQCHVDYRIK